MDGALFRPRKQTWVSTSNGPQTTSERQGDETSPMPGINSKENKLPIALHSIRGYREFSGRPRGLPSSIADIDISPATARCVSESHRTPHHAGKTSAPSATPPLTVTVLSVVFLSFSNSSSRKHPSQFLFKVAIHCVVWLPTPANPTPLSIRTVIMSLSNKLAITDVDLKDKRVLIRVCGPLLWANGAREHSTDMNPVNRSTSTFPSTTRRRSPTTSVSSVPSPPSSTPSRMAPRPSSSCPTWVVPMARRTTSTA